MAWGNGIKLQVCWNAGHQHFVDVKHTCGQAGGLIHATLNLPAPPQIRTRGPGRYCSCRWRGSFQPSWLSTGWCGVRAGTPQGEGTWGPVVGTSRHRRIQTQTQKHASCSHTLGCWVSSLSVSPEYCVSLAVTVPSPPQSEPQLGSPLITAACLCF